MQREDDFTLLENSTNQQTFFASYKYSPMLYKQYEEKIKYEKFSIDEYLPVIHEGFSTIAIHEGHPPEPIHGSVNVPIHMSTTYAQKDIG